MGCAPFDFDGDGDFDVTCDNGGSAVLANSVIRDTWPSDGTPYQALLRNDGEGNFTDIAAEVGLDGLPPLEVSGTLGHMPQNFQRMPWGWGISTGDVDNDGREDLYQTGSFAVLPLLVVGYADQGAHPGALLRRSGDGGFSDITQAAGIANVRDDGYLLPSWGNLLVDLTGDGALDVVICNHSTSWMQGGIRLFRNPGTRHHWAAFKLRGTVSNRDGVGAVVRLFAAGKVQMRAITVGGWGGSPLPAHFGLGEEAAIDRIEIDWPSGRHQVVTHPPIDRMTVIDEP
jgi:enediyne biosynthesis protein E4